MKTILKAIGFIVLVVVLAAAVLYYLNSHGYISGDLSEWINRMTGHVVDMTNETKDFLEDEGYLPSAAPTEQPTPDATAEPVTTTQP